MYKIVSFDLQSYRYLCADRKHDGSAGYVLSRLPLLLPFLHKSSKEGIPGKSSVVGFMMTVLPTLTYLFCLQTDKVHNSTIV